MSTPYAKQLGHDIRQWRVARGWNQQQLADAIGAARNSVSRWETGDGAPNPVQLHLLSQLMERDLRQLTVVAPEELAVVLDAMKAELDAWWRTFRVRLLAAAQGEALPAEGPLDDSDAIEATAMRALLAADQAAAAAPSTPAPPAAAPRAASGTRSRRPR